MILHYLYIKEYACLKDARMRFSGKYRFRYSPQSGHLVADLRCPLSEDFFSLSGNIKSKVDSVSAVVGSNGAGKTSIARSLQELCLPRNDITDFVLFVEMEGKDSHQHHFEERAVFVGCGVRAVGTNESNMYRRTQRKKTVFRGANQYSRPQPITCRN